MLRDIRHRIIFWVGVLSSFNALQRNNGFADQFPLIHWIGHLLLAIVVIWLFISFYRKKERFFPSTLVILGITYAISWLPFAYSYLLVIVITLIQLYRNYRKDI